MIKRALLLALAVLALALFAVFRPATPSVEGPAVSDAPEAAVQSESVSALEIPAANAQKARASLAAEATDPVVSSPDFVRVRVRYRGTGAAVPRAVVMLATKVIRTDDAGEARVDLPAGTHLALLKVIGDDEGPPFIPYERNLDESMPPGGCEFEVLVDRGADLRGVVVDAANGRPIRCAKVRYHGLARNTEMYSRDDGSFEFVALIGGPWNPPHAVSVEEPNYLASEVRPTLANLDPQSEPLRIALQSGLRVTGKLVDREHAPVVGAELMLFGMGSRGAVSDQFGNFEFGGLLPAENASITVDSQSVVGGAILGTTLELGALEANRLDLELEVRAAWVVRIYAELADGTALRSSLFEVSCPSGVATGPQRFWKITYGEDLPYRERIVPRGAPFVIEAFTRVEGESDPKRLLRGELNVRPEPGAVSPLDVRIVLDESYRAEIPPAPPGAQEIDLFASGLLEGAFDVQLFDEFDGEPIAREGLVTLHNVGETVPLQLRKDGWVRWRGSPGVHGVWLEYRGGSRQWYTFTIPWTGYGKAEWRLRPGK